MSGLGWSELYIDGKKVGDQVLSPAFTDYTKRVEYVVHDVSGMFQEGNNAIGVILGNGFLSTPREVTSVGTATAGRRGCCCRLNWSSPTARSRPSCRTNPGSGPPAKSRSTICGTARRLTPGSPDWVGTLRLHCRRLEGRGEARRARRPAGAAVDPAHPRVRIKQAR